MKRRLSRGAVEVVPDIFMMIIMKRNGEEAYIMIMTMIMSAILTMLYIVMRISMTTKNHDGDKNTDDNSVICTVEVLRS